MSVFNCSLYLKEAIDSILSQSYTNFEFLIIDDASTDDSYSILSTYKDSRIRLFRNVINLRLSKSLNLLLDVAKGEYIVRMDADDVSLPERISKQVQFMDLHSQIGLCGTSRRVYKDGVISDFNTEDSLYMNDKLLDGNCIAHPTVIIRKSFLDIYRLRYNPKYKSSQDYELWTRMALLFPIANIPEVLLIYRHHDKQTGVAKALEQKMFNTMVQNKIYKNIFFKKKKEKSKFHLIKSIIRNYILIIKYKFKLLKII
jgi:glycosyltransferase involved in cell wall biosynthesis